MKKAKTLGELRASGYGSRSVKDEMRANLIKKLRAGEKLFPGVLGYEETVIPQIVNAILAKHNLILLGLRGQAKSRIIRQLTDLFDEEIPIIAGSEINDDPFAPLSAYGKNQIELHGDETKIDWITGDNRFVEKLATPDVTIADIIGDIDPIKAAKGGHLLSDELTIFYGLLPRANRGIFAINELPDLSGKNPGRTVQYYAGRRRADQRFSCSSAFGRDARFLGKPRRLHGSRKNYHAAQR